MDIADILRPAAVFANVRASGKRVLLELLAQRASPLVKISADEIFEKVWEREKLNSTGVGQGVAIPHGRLKSSQAIFGLFARLETSVEFESIDGLPVDLVFLLLTPEGAGADHLKALARVSRIFRNHGICEKLRSSADTAALFAILTEPAANIQAA